MENKRGPNDLEQRIEDLEKQKEYLQGQCRKAGKTILDQEVKILSLGKDLDRVSEERDNFVTMLGDGKK